MIGFGQNDDILKMQNEIENTNYRMKKFHKQYFNGVFVLVTGSTIAIVGVLLPNPLIAIVGGVVTLAGNIVTINSHKWFNRDSINKKNYKSKIIKNRKRELAKLLESRSMSQEEYDEALLEINKQLQLENLLKSGSISKKAYDKEISKINKTID